MANYYDVVIAAGGQGIRMNARRPKALIPVNGRSLISYTLQALLEAGYSHPLICIDDPTTENEYRQVTPLSANISILCSPRVQSTFELVRNHLTDCADRFLFMYGHAPRPSGELIQLQNTSATLGAYCVRYSSVISKVMLDDGKILEPPYVLNKSYIESSRACSWKEFFALHQHQITTLQGEGPPEFNYPYEFENYKLYIGRAFK